MEHIFKFEENPIRVIADERANTWFCLADVCKVLDIGNPAQLRTRLNQEGIITSDTPTAGGMQQMTYISEQNLYKAIFQSRKPEAERFTDWVTGDVLPSIRRDGGYMAARQDESPEVIMARALQIANATLERNRAQLQEANRQIAELAPDADYTRLVLTADNLHTTDSVAVMLGISAIRLNRFLSANNWIYRVGGVWRPFTRIRERGYCGLHIITYGYDEQGRVKTREHLKWTEAGRRAIIELWQSGIAKISA